MEKTKEDLEKALRDKGPSFTYRYLMCYYKEVALFKETEVYQDLLNNMSPEGQARFEEDIACLEELAESKENWTDEEYENWSKKHFEIVRSNEELSEAAVHSEELGYKTIRAENDFYQNCKIHLRDRVRLLEDYDFPKGLVGTVIDYSIGEEINDHFMKVEFRLVEPETNKLLDINECSVPIRFLEVVERWDSGTNEYITTFDKNEKAFPKDESLDLGTIYNNDDKEEYGYPYRENETSLTTETESFLPPETQNLSTKKTNKLYKKVKSVFKK